MDQQDKGGETRPAQAGETGTTRFGMEDGDNTDISTVGLADDGDVETSADTNPEKDQA